MSGRKGTGGTRLPADYTPISALLKVNALTTSTVAKESGVPRQWLWRYRMGLYPISPLHLGKLCAYFDVEPEELQTPSDIIAAARSVNDRPSAINHYERSGPGNDAF